MKLRPTIFLSGVSSEFASYRDAAADEILRKGCYPLNQPTFDVDYREIETILREKLSEADAVVHIVGFRFGDEPKGRPADKPRRSYTQLEFDVARQLEKPVYLFLSSDATVRDSKKSEDPLVVELQLAHRKAIENGNDQYHFFRDKDELRRLVAGIKHVAQTEFRVDISRLDRYAPAELIGREEELALLNNAWLRVRRAEPKRPHVLTFVGLGGEGKTSLVTKWLADLAHENWPGCDSVLAWSFYSQGTNEQTAGSSDLFLKEAITFFGDEADKQFANSPAGAYQKGQRLARIVGQRRALLILDGLEPLQISPISPTPGELKDEGIAALLKGLAAYNDGLCIVTTRYSVPDLKAFWQTTATEISLTRLSQAAGVLFLKNLGVKGSISEFENLVDDVKGHALTLNLLGTYLCDAHGGDIGCRYLVTIEEADAEEQGGHAFRVMEAYQHVFENQGDRGKRALAILHLLGLFDRSMTRDCFDALRKEPVISGLTEYLAGSSEALNVTIKRLGDLRLITVNRETFGRNFHVDAHALVREYFGKQLRSNKPDAWRAAHHRLFDHLCTSTPDKSHPTLEDLQPLYQAIAHGCQAGLLLPACLVFFKRIDRGESYSVNMLGAFSSDLGAFAWFFETPWALVWHELKDVQGWLLGETAFRLRALGRLVEAIEPTTACLEIHVKAENWKAAAVAGSNLSEIKLTLGSVIQAVEEAAQAQVYADTSGDTFQRVRKRTAHADALFQAGEFENARARFSEAEQIQSKTVPELPFLYSVMGLQYCSLLIANVERDAWLQVLQWDETIAHLPHENELRDVSHRASQMLKWAEAAGAPILDFAISYLMIGRTALYTAVLDKLDLRHTNASLNLRHNIEAAVEEFRRAGAQEFLPHGLLTRAWLRALSGSVTGPASAQEDLAEAWEIAERGPMRLHMADIRLYRARLFFREKEYPWESREADLAAARKLIEQCGYWRRKEELEDAERVILKKSA